jgi:hypothetical protein
MIKYDGNISELDSFVDSLCKEFADKHSKFYVNILKMLDFIGKMKSYHDYMLNLRYTNFLTNSLRTLSASSCYINR